MTVAELIVDLFEAPLHAEVFFAEAWGQNPRVVPAKICALFSDQHDNPCVVLIERLEDGIEPNGVTVDVP